MGSVWMKGTFRAYPGMLRYDFMYVNADSLRGNMGQGRDEVSECGV